MRAGYKNLGPGPKIITPYPSATVTSGTLAANTLDQGSGGVSGQSGQHNQQPEEWDWTMDKKVRYFICWIIENHHLSEYLNPYEGLSNKILLNFFVYYREVCSKLTFQPSFLNIEFMQMFIMGVHINFSFIMF